MESQGDLVSSFIAPITQIEAPNILIINLLTKSPLSSFITPITQIEAPNILIINLLTKSPSTSGWLRRYGKALTVTVLEPDYSQDATQNTLAVSCVELGIITSVYGLHRGYIAIIWGLYRDYIGGLYGDNGK